MPAVNWLRTRQEEYELNFWLSLAFYDKHDRSLSNRAYLVYLFIFFSVWIFVVLTFFASGGAYLLRIVNDASPVQAALLIDVSVLGIWCILSLYQACRHSPLVFSEQDATLICQTPVDRSGVVMRWLPMPWLKSALPFWLVNITIGFSLAEITMPGSMGITRIGEYAVYGLRAWVVMIPIQLALFTLQWIVGVARLHKDSIRNWLIWPVVTAAGLIFGLLLSAFFDGNTPLLLTARFGANLILYPLRQGFTSGNLLPAVGINAIIALVGLGLLFWTSRSFNLTHAVQETHESENIHSAIRTGMTDYASELQSKKHLGVMRAPSKLPMFSGSSLFLWKDIVQSQRSFQLRDLYNWITIFGLMFGFSLLPDLASRAISFVIWVIWVGKVSVLRIRVDLSCWSLVRQLPVSHQKFLLSESASSWFLATLLSITGFLLGSFVTQKPDIGFALILPVLTAGISLISTFDVIRRSRSPLLFTGSVANIGAVGILFGIILASIPFLIFSLFPGGAGIFLALASSLVLSLIAFFMAVYAYNHIDSV